MKNAKMKDALVEALTPQISIIAIRKIANQKPTALELQIHLHIWVKKILQRTLREHTLVETKKIQISLFHCL